MHKLELKWKPRQNNEYYKYWLDALASCSSNENYRNALYQLCGVANNAQDRIDEIQNYINIVTNNTSEFEKNYSYSLRALRDELSKLAEKIKALEGMLNKRAKNRKKRGK